MGSKQSVNEFWHVYVISPKTKFYQKCFEKCSLELAPGHILAYIFKESSVKVLLLRIQYNQSVFNISFSNTGCA